MRILHISDTHGALPVLNLSRVDLIVHSGDWFPNITRGNRQVEHQFQAEWVQRNGDKLRAWTQGVPVAFIPGNHDFLENQQDHLRAVGLDATDITGSVHMVGDVPFYGFPWVTRFTGEWNYEASEVEMKMRAKAVPDDVAVLVSHGPIYGVLDHNAYGEHCGSQELILPYTALLHGHIHESNGVTVHQAMLVSNAATTQHVIDL